MIGNVTLAFTAWIKTPGPLIIGSNSWKALGEVVHLNAQRARNLVIEL